MRSLRGRQNRAQSHANLLAALRELWRMLNIDNKVVKSADIDGVCGKFKISRISQKMAATLKGVQYPDDEAARAFRKRLNEVAYASKLRRKEREKESKSDPETPAADKTHMSEEDFHVNLLVETRDWLNTHGYICEVKLARQVLTQIL